MSMSSLAILAVLLGFYLGVLVGTLLYKIEEEFGFIKSIKAKRKYRKEHRK